MTSQKSRRFQAKKSHLFDMAISSFSPVSSLVSTSAMLTIIRECLTLMFDAPYRVCKCRNKCYKSTDRNGDSVKKGSEINNLMSPHRYLNYYLIDKFYGAKSILMQSNVPVCICRTRKHQYMRMLNPDRYIHQRCPIEASDISDNKWMVILSI